MVPAIHANDVTHAIAMGTPNSTGGGRHQAARVPIRVAVGRHNATSGGLLCLCNCCISWQTAIPVKIHREHVSPSLTPTSAIGSTHPPRSQ